MGEQNAAAVATEEMVKRIRCEIGLTQIEVASKYGLSRTAAAEIMRGDTWKHIGSEGVG